MPCRRPGAERFLLLEGGGGGGGEVDALVARLGEVLQLSAHPRPAKHRGRDRVAPYSSPQPGLGLLASLHPAPAAPRSSLLLLQPPPSGSPRVAKQLCGRGWLRSAARAGGRRKRQQLLREEDEDEDDDDPHRLLQQLILSGNLIKEAVRRLQLATSTAPSAPAEASTTDSPGSASSIGSCHSSLGEGDTAAAAAPPGVAANASPLQPLP